MTQNTGPPDLSNNYVSSPAAASEQSDGRGALQTWQDSRAQLTAAVEIFGRLRARPWAARAASELRAAGQTAPRASQRGRDSLTPQELEIAELAAAGLTNKQIGQRLFLSHRTVGAHLYQIFPKLGVTSRAALRDALDSLPPEPYDEDHI